MFKNMQGMMQQAQKMQQKMQEVQAQLEASEHFGESGAGMVSITMNGKYDVKKITINLQIVDGNDVEMLEDLILAALCDVKNKVDAYASTEMGKVTQGMPIPPGLKMPF